jgi:hypothetical protein
MKKHLIIVIILHLFILTSAQSISGTFKIKNEIDNERVVSLFEWKQLIGKENAGFGKDTNHAIRGLEIYKDELYLGTQSLNKSKLSKESWMINDMLYNSLPYFGLSGYQSFIFMKKHLLSNQLFKRCNVNKNNFLMIWLDISLNLAMHKRSLISEGCEIWKYNYSRDVWFQLIGNEPEADLPEGFGERKNIAISVMKNFKGKLYVGTWTSPFRGCEIWRYDGIAWEQVVGKNALIKGGFNDSKNIAAWCIEEFNDHLYVGTMNWGYVQDGGCQIWRTQDGIHWSKMLDRGFRDFLPESKQNVHNTYAWSAEVYQDCLYIGTFNTNSVFGFEHNGCQLWRTPNGEIWEKVECPGGDGFGEKENYGIRCMVVYNNELYIATATDGYQLNGPNVQGFEIYKYNGIKWTEIIGENGSNQHEKDGFGSKWNKYVWSMIVTSDNKLWIGTLNMQIRMLGEDTKGCEVWCYNGSSWTPIVKDQEGEIASGFGCIYNEGARAMIEYPKGSGNIIFGTFKLMKTFINSEGCEVWIRY